jgi:hypothetical protein
MAGGVGVVEILDSDQVVTSFPIQCRCRHYSKPAAQRISKTLQTLAFRCTHTPPAGACMAKWILETLQMGAKCCTVLIRQQESGSVRLAVQK